jgi:IclR family transcriptional regulator, pca regulon regulatory protein
LTDMDVAARPDVAEGADSKNFVTAFARGLSVMTAFSGQNRPMTLSDVARIVELPRATVRRCLLTLQALNYVESDGRYFSLAPQILMLARAYLSSSILPRVAQPFLERVSESTGESCSVSILHGADVIYIARSGRRRIASLHRDVGTHLPAFCTSMGRILLATLPPKELDKFLATARFERFTPRTVMDPGALRDIITTVAHDGLCEVNQEFEIDLLSIAIPVRNTSGTIVAAMNVSTNAGRTTRKHLRGPILSALRQAAADMRPLLIT